MEQHPVPQNVTTFQFRLIGDMTIKQFGYLAGGILLGYICYKLPLPFFFTWPLALISGLGGFGLAFVPIEERPMDVWVLSFFKNVYSPTQYIWQKQKPIPEPDTRPTVQTKMPPARNATHSVAGGPAQPLQGTSDMHAQTPPEGFHMDVAGRLQPHPGPAHHDSVRPPQPSHHKESRSALLERLFSFSHPKEQITLPHESRRLTPHAPPVVLSERIFDPIGKLMNMLHIGPHRTPVASTPFSDALANVTITGYRPQVTGKPQVMQPQPVAPPTPIQSGPQMLALEKKLQELEGQLAAKTISDTRILELQKQLTDVLGQKGVMEQELRELQKKLRGHAPQPTQTAIPVTPKSTSQPTVRIVTSDMASRFGLPRLTTFPNVVTGITKDHEGNLLPGVLVTVRDKDGVPLRALKTNKLGQFAASTPLPNATYLIEVEDPRNRFTFDRAQLTLNGGVVPAIEIIAKSQKQIDREKLAKEIFGNQ